VYKRLNTTRINSASNPAVLKSAYLPYLSDLGSQLVDAPNAGRNIVRTSQSSNDVDSMMWTLTAEPVAPELLLKKLRGVFSTSIHAVSKLIYKYFFFLDASKTVDPKMYQHKDEKH
jgi:hypothetical protein